MRFVKIAIVFIISAIVGAVCVLIILAASEGVNFSSLKAYVILSGSMEPQLPLGSIVAVKPISQYSVGDIISYTLDSDDKIPITHRVTKVYGTSTQNNLSYETRGDTNNVVDSASVKQSQIVGKVFLTIPYIGYVAQATKSQKGFIFLIIVPSTIIIYEELKTLKKELTNLLKKSKSNKANGRALIFVPMIASIFVLTSHSQSFFSDKETSSNNSFQAGAWTTPSLSPTIAPIKVVINEVYYDVAAGKGSEISPANDEWVELYNNTDQPVNIKDWTIADNTSTTTIYANVNVPAFGFVLLAKDANTWIYWSVPSGVEKISLGQEIGSGLANGGDRLTLKDNDGNTIDQMSYGTDTTYFSLTPTHDGHSWERNPDGLDTNTAADFIDQTNPTPGTL